MYAIVNNNTMDLDRLDDFGLNPIQMRVYIHLLRMAQNNIVEESTDKISKICGLSRTTVMRVLQQLENLGMLKWDRAIGKKSVFCLMPDSNWKKETCTPAVQVQPVQPVSEVNNLPVQQESMQTPLGGLLDSAAVQLEPVAEMNNSNLSNPDTGSPEIDNEVFVPTGNLAEKIDVLRSRGVNACSFKRGLYIYVQAGGKEYTEAEFMALPIESFDIVKATIEDRSSCFGKLIPMIKRMSIKMRADFLRERKKLGLPIPPEFCVAT